MKNFLSRLAYKMQAFMYGRYGYDALSRALSVGSIVLIVASLFFYPLYALALIALVYSMFRTYSKNIAARRRELDLYEKHTKGIRLYFKRLSNMWRDRKTHRYYKCPKCGAYLRVPRGKGEIIITCAVCKNKIERKT